MKTTEHNSSLYSGSLLLVSNPPALFRSKARTARAFSVEQEELHPCGFNYFSHKNNTRNFCHPDGIQESEQQR